MSEADECSDSFPIAIVDNDSLALFALNALIQRRLPQIRLVWSVTSGKESVLRCVGASRNSWEKPSLLLVDMSMEGMSGPEICREIRLRSLNIALLGMTSFSLDCYSKQALRCGADCLVDKANAKSICTAIFQLAAGKHPTVGVVSQENREACQRRLQQHTSAKAECRSILTPSEIAIMDRLVSWKSTAQIAAELGISQSTVNTQIARAARKLGAASRMQAAHIWAMMNNAAVE